MKNFSPEWYLKMYNLSDDVQSVRHSYNYIRTQSEYEIQSSLKQ